MDVTVVCQPGSKGSDRRVHARYDPAQGRFTDLVSTTGHVAERADLTHIRAGPTTIIDRGYALQTNLWSILAQRGYFIVRIDWQSLHLYNKNSQKTDLLSLLSKDDRTVDRIVHFNGLQQPLRLPI